MLFDKAKNSKETIRISTDIRRWIQWVDCTLITLRDIRNDATIFENEREITLEDDIKTDIIFKDFTNKFQQAYKELGQNIVESLQSKSSELIEEFNSLFAGWKTAKTGEKLDIMRKQEFSCWIGKLKKFLYEVNPSL